MDRVGAADVGDPGLGKTEEPYFSTLHQISHRACHLLDRHGRIDSVLIEEIDVVSAEPAQGSLHRLNDMLRPAISFGADLFSGLDTKAKLGGDHRPVSTALERHAEQFLVE